MVPSAPADVRRVGADTAWGVLRVYLRAPTIWVLALQWVVVAVLRLRGDVPGPGDVAEVAGVALLWPLFEWAAHNGLLHLRPRRVGPFTLDPFSAYVHRYHHDNPWELEPIFVPWPVIVGLLPVNAALWLALAPTRALALTGILAITTAALAYELVHLLAHVPYKPPVRWLRRVQGHHRTHHFRKEEGWYAFSVPALDRWLGTQPPTRPDRDGR